MTERACRVCGCTQNNACLTPDGPCYWVAPDLCSGCAPEVKRRTILNGLTPTQLADLQHAQNLQTFVRDMQAQITKALGMPARMFPREQRFDRPGRRPADSAPKSDHPTLEPPKVG